MLFYTEEQSNMYKVRVPDGEHINIVSKDPDALIMAISSDNDKTICWIHQTLDQGTEYINMFAR